MDNKVTISPSQFQEGLRRMIEASGKWSTGNTWIGDEPPTEPQYAMWVDTSGENDKLRFKTSTGEWREISGSGSNMGGSGGVAIVPISEYEQTVSSGDECLVKFEWSTLNSETAKGTITVYINSTQKYVKIYEQGRVEVPVQDYLVSGRTNEVKVVVRDIYGSENTYTFYISVISITISSPFKQNTILEKEKYPEFYSMPVVVKGGLNKIIHVVLDGVERPDSSLPVAAEDAGTTQYVKIPSCSHGSHTLELYATAQLGEDTMKSNSIFYDLLWTEEGNFKTIIASQYNIKEADQYEILEIPYYVYNPASANSEVFFEINGELLSSEAKLVAQKEEVWDASGSLVGENVFVIMSGGTTKTIKVNLREVETVNVVPVTNAMPVCFVADKLRTNTSEDRDIWASTGELEGLKAEFRNFNWKTNGWQTVNNKGALRISDGASLYIPYHIFEGAIVAGSDTDIKTNGGTIEVDLTFDDVTNVDATFLSCMSEGRGIEVTPTKAIIKSSGAYTHTLFTDGVNKGTSMRFSFVITPEDPGVMYIYINGIGASASTYTSTDRFKHDSNPVGVTINSEGCSVTLHSFRVYRSALTQQQIIRNWIYDMASVADQVNAHKRNDIYDKTSTSGGVLYSKVVERIPCMIITGSMPSYKGEKKIVDIEFEGTKDGLYDFVLRQAQIDVQGTSSQYYPLKNWKFKSEYKIEDDMGNVIKKFKGEFETKDGVVYEYPLADDQIPSNVFCLKADYMESSSTHNTVTANIANGMYSEKTPPQKKDSTGKTRTTIYGRPIIVFYRESEGGELIFGGKYNFNYDKDSEAVFGFTKDKDYEVVECVEFCNNTSERCLLQKSEYINKVDAPAGYDGDDIDANGQIPEYLQDFEFRYQWRREPTNNIKYDYLKAVTDWVVSTDRTKATGEPLATPYTTNIGIAVYLYDIDMNIVTFTDSEGRTRRAIDIGLGNLEYAYESHDVVIKDEDGNDVNITYYALPLDKDGLEMYSFTHDTPAYRLTKFKNELSEHFNIHYSLMYYHLIDLLGMIDSSTKNCFWATWGERYKSDDPAHDHSDPSKDKVVIWYPIFYDMDTMLGLSNMGKMDIPYNAEFDSLMPNSTTSYVFNGHSNVFWNNIKDAFVAELNTLFRSKVSDGTFSQQAILSAYEEHGENFSESIYNEDGNLKVISPYIDGYYGYSEDSPDEMVTQHPDYVYIYQGDRFYHRRYWFPNRYNYVCSKNMAGSYVTDYITMRLNTPAGELVVPANSDFTVTTYADQYTRVKYGSKTVYSRCEHNIPTKIIAPRDIFNDTETIIYGASRIMSIGSLADKYARSIDLSKASRLTVADIGSDIEGYANENLDEINFGSNPMLQEVYLQNCSKLGGTLSLIGCPRIRIIKANGTEISLLEVPSVGALEEVVLPNTMTSLTLVEHPNLNKFTLDSMPVIDEESGEVDYKYNLTSIRVEETPIDTLDLVKHSPQLTRIRLTGINWDIEDDKLLHRIKNDLSGFDANGRDQDKPVLMGDCKVLNMMDYIEKEFHSYFNNGVPYDQLPELSNRDFRLTVTNSIKTHIVRFFNQPRPEDIPIEMDSGITDKRVIDEKFAEYRGVTPLKSEDWAKTYEFANWGVYKDGELVMIEDLSSYEILEDTDFYAMYSETKKQFTVNYYDINFDTKEYGIYKTDVFTYDECSVAEVLPDNYSHNEHTMRFSGWSALPNASEADISGGSIIIVNDGSPYVQDVYAVYWKDYKYRVKFIDYDNSVIIEEKIYYIGREPIVVPSDPIREHTTEYVFEFDGWICNDGEKFTEIPAVGGTVRSYIYKASYSYDWRPYVIKFINYDGTVLQESKVKYGYVPEYTDEIPEKPDTAQWDYTFDKWSPDITSVTGDATYTAMYSSVIQKYKITWLNDDGSLIDTTEVEYGAIPEHEDATKPSDVQYTYVFAGWHIEPYSVDGDMTYKARYTNVTNKYLVTWENWDGSVLQAGTLVPYGEMPEYIGDAPTRPENQAEWYKFIGWDADVTEDVIETEPFNVVGHVTYRAWYEPIKQQYTITFKDYDGTIKYSELLDYGTSIIPPVVSREGYTFIGWGSEYTTVVNGDATYEAQYDINYYTIKFIGYTDFEGNTKEEIIHTLPYGSPVPTPYKIDRVGYNFKGWDSEIPNIVPAEDVTINALYEIIKFTIKFVDYNGSVLKSEVLGYGSMPTAPTPTRTGFTFKGWDSSITTVSGDKTYTAKYEVSIYTITWVLGDHVETSQCVHGTTPTPPYQAGYVHTHRGVPLTLKGWHTSIVTAVNDVTYRGVMTGSLTPSLTLAALPTKASSTQKSFTEGFLKGSDYIFGGSTNDPFILYGLDFSALSEFNNIEFTDIKFTSSVRGNSSSKSGYFRVRFATDFTNITSDYRLYEGEDYTGVGSGYTAICDIAADDTTYDSYVMNTDDFPGVLEWMNTYPDKVLRGKTEAVFGMVFSGTQYRCNSVSYQFNFKVS